MKKRILITFIALFLVGCQNTNANQQGKEEESIIQETTVSRMDFIDNTFESYNYKAPDKSNWLIKEEGPHKVVVIIKEPVPQQKPLITKLILIDDGSYKIEFLQIENQIHIK